MKYIYLFIGSLLLGLLISCGATQPHNTLAKHALSDQLQQEPDDESGLGGTGMLAQESGLGGTGMLAHGSGLGGTGIVGEVTGFGSIFVNGEKLELNARTQLFVDGEAGSQQQLSRGDVVAVRATAHKQRLFASEVHLRHELIGPVQKIMPGGQRLIILGQRVNVGAQPLPQLGQTVRVSGFRDQQGVIHATLLRRADSAQVLLVGKLRHTDNGWFIGQQPLRLAAGAAWTEGQQLRIRGRLEAKIVQVSQWSALPGLPFQQPVSRLLLQGFVQGAGSDYRIAGQLFSVTSGHLQKQLSQRKEQPLRLELRGSASHWRASRLLVPQRLPMGRPSPVRAGGSRWQSPVVPRLPRYIKPVPGRFMR
jgi:hypothetical protein